MEEDNVFVIWESGTAESFADREAAEAEIRGAASRGAKGVLVEDMHSFKSAARSFLEKVSGTPETSMETKCATPSGGCVKFNEEVTVSSHVAGVAGEESIVTYAWLRKKDKRVKKSIEVFFNSESGLLVVDVIDANDNGGVEVFRRELL